MARITVERVGPYGIQSGGKWYKPSGFAKPPIDLKGLAPGVEVEVNAKGYITGVAGGGSAMTTATEAVPTSGAESNKTYRPSSFAANNKNDPSVRMEIARGTAVKAVFGSVLLFEIYRPSRDEQGKITGEFKAQEVIDEVKVLVEQTTNYIATGKWDSDMPVTARTILEKAVTENETTEVPF